MNIAVDAGFGRTKGSNGRGYVVSFPSQVSVYNPVRFESGVGGDQDMVDRLAVSFDNYKYFVGSAAARQGIVQNTIDKNRAVNTEGRALLLAALSMLVQEPMQSCNLVAGLPVSHYTSLKEKFSRAARTTHFFKTLTMTGEVEQDFIVTIDDLKIIPQPFGTLFHCLLDDSGGVNDGELAGQNVGIIDVGYHTADFARADSLEFIDRKSISYPLGIFAAYAELSRAVNEEFGIETEPAGIEDVMGSGLLKVGGSVYDVKVYRDQALKATAQQVISKAKTLWSDRWQMDKIILTGGGGALLAKHINSDVMEVPVQEAVSPMMANVLGYMKLANRSWEAV